MNPFPILLPELWVLIRSHLCTRWDARSRVRLQRVCKAARALDPGLILAVGWRDAMAALDGNTPSLVLRYRRCAELMYVMTEFFTTNLWDEPWFKEPSLVCVYTVHTGSPETLVRTNFVLDVAASYVLSIDYSPTKSTPWRCKFFIYDAVYERHAARKFATLQDLLTGTPMLGQGLDPRLIGIMLDHGQVANLLFIQ
jgi:hypothetical protein